VTTRSAMAITWSMWTETYENIQFHTSAAKML